MPQAQAAKPLLPGHQAIIDIDKFLDVLVGGSGLQRKHIAGCLQHLNTVVNEHKTLTEKVAELEKRLETVNPGEEPEHDSSDR